MCPAAEHAKFRHAGTWQRAVPPIVSANISRERTPHPDDGDILAAFDCRMHYLARVASANGQQQSQNICRYGLQDNGRDNVAYRLIADTPPPAGAGPSKSKQYQNSRDDEDGS